MSKNQVYQCYFVFFQIQVELQCFPWKLFTLLFVYIHFPSKKLILKYCTKQYTYKLFSVIWSSHDTEFSQVCFKFINMFHNRRRFFTDVLYKQEYFTSNQKILIVHMIMNHNTAVLLIHKIIWITTIFNLMPFLRPHAFIQRLAVHLCNHHFRSEHTLLCLACPSSPTVC